jgi:hypothetical protein
MIRVKLWTFIQHATDRVKKVTRSLRKPRRVRTATDDVTAFKALLERVWGKEAATLPGTIKGTNNVIGALNNSQFETFTENFIARLKRLARVYSAFGHDRQSVMNTVRQIASRTWEGAFAELTAYDYFNCRSAGWQSIVGNVATNVNIDGARTYARHFGRPGDANLDGQFRPYEVFFDVKAFKDNVKEILEGVYDEVHRCYASDKPEIAAEYPLALHYEGLQLKRSALVNELVNAFDPRHRSTFFKSSVLPEFSFRAKWGAGVLMTTHEHDPYDFAKRYYFDVFNHADKFVRDRPSFIVYVVFPWYNLLTEGFEGHNERFYRSFARRVFCEFRHLKHLMSSRIPGFTGPPTIWEVSQDLSAILFLEDKTIRGDSDEMTKTDAYCYVNPNAKNPICRGIFEEAINGFPRRVFDTFGYDNY